MFEPFSSVGNLFFTFMEMLPVVRFLEVGLVLDYHERFPEFRQVFEPNKIMWDVDPAPFKQRALEIEQGGDISGFHAAIWYDGVIVLSDHHLELLSLTLGINARTLPELASIIVRPNGPPMLRNLFSLTYRSLVAQEYVNVEPCAWNMFLKRSLKIHSPWTLWDNEHNFERRPTNYVGWHIRTANGESKTSYSPHIHTYILQEPAEVVCPAFLVATEAARTACPKLLSRDTNIYISSNSKNLARSCIKDLDTHGFQGRQVDMGLGPEDGHIKFSHHPAAAMNAFLDYMLLLDAAAIIRTGSSFSGTITKIRGLKCLPSWNSELPHRQLYVCTPNNASC